MNRFKRKRKSNGFKNAKTKKDENPTTNSKIVHRKNSKIVVNKREKWRIQKLPVHLHTNFRLSTFALIW